MGQARDTPLEEPASYPSIQTIPLLRFLLITPSCATNVFVCPIVVAALPTEPITRLHCHRRAMCVLAGLAVSEVVVATYITSPITRKPRLHKWTIAAARALHLRAHVHGGAVWALPSTLRRQAGVADLLCHDVKVLSRLHLPIPLLFLGGRLGLGLPRAAHRNTGNLTWRRPEASWRSLRHRGGRRHRCLRRRNL